MRLAVVLGTGGHCRVLLSLLAAAGQHQVLQIIELGAPRPDERIMGIAVTPTAEDLTDLAGRIDIDIFLAIGDNALRQLWWARIKELGLPMPNLVSPHALIDPTANLGGANVVCAHAFIGPESRIGHNNLINTGAIVEHEVVIGDHCHLAPSTTIAGRTCLKDRCFIGAGATLIDKLSVAAGTTVAAGAVLARDVKEANGIYVGVPARRKEVRP